MSDFIKPVLAFDCALGGCVGAVIKDGAALASFAIPMAREQAAQLIPMVENMLRSAGVSYADLGLIVTSIGPGSFTGLRISLSAAKAMAAALSVPLQGVTTLEAMARSAVPEDRPCLAVLETKRTDFYVQAFDANKSPMEEARCMEADDLRAKITGSDYILCGDGLPRLGAEGRARELYDPVILAQAGLRHFLQNRENPVPAVPFYLRGADVSFSNKIQRTIKDFPA